MRTAKPILPLVRLTSLISASLVAFVVGHVRLAEAAPTAATFSDREIDEIWKELRAMMPEGTPPITPMTDAELVKALTGEWICLMAEDPYAKDRKVSLAIRANREAVLSGTAENGPWTDTGEWRAADRKIVLFMKAGDLPGFVFPAEEKFFIFNPFVTPMRSELLRNVTPENASEIDSGKILEYYWSPESLEAMGERALEHLTAVLMKPVEDEGYRHHRALTAIDLLRPPPDNVLPAMTDCLDRGVSSAALLMARVGGPDAVKPLVAALTNSNANVRADAAWTLADMRPNEDGHLRMSLNGDERVWKNFRPVADVVSPALIERLRDQDATVRHRSAHALSQIGGDPKRAVPALVESLGDTNRLVREHAAAALGRFGVNEGPVPSALRKLLNDPVPFVRAAAQRSLKELGIPVAPK